MTTTTTESTRCQQPCWCDRCWYTTVSDLIGERAVLLHGALADHLYTDGLERDLAAEVIAAIPASRRGDVLEHMLTWDHLMGRVMAVDCLLDECDNRSYQALEQMSGILLAAIKTQDHEGGALRILIVNEITSSSTAAAYSSRLVS